MNSVMLLFAFLGCLAAYCVIVLVLSAVKSAFLTNESLNDEDFWFDICFAQFVIAIVVLVIYFSNIMSEVS